MIRYGKNLAHMLNAAARLDADFGRGRHLWLDTSANKTRLQKAIRQRVTLLSKTVCRMQDWDVYECQLPGRTDRSRHIVGTVDYTKKMRVSTAIVSIESAWRKAITETGEKFHFGGQVQGGVNVDTYFAWWRDKQGASEVTRVTQEVRRLLAPVRYSAVGRSEEEMWAEKRARQAADLAGLQSGELSNDDVNWFAGGIARNAKIITPLFSDAHPSIVDLLANKEQGEKDWLQSPDDRSFNDEMGGDTRYKKESKNGI